MNRHAKPQPSCADGKARLMTLLYSCRPHMLATFTPEQLARTHRLSGNQTANVRLIEYELTIARQNRATEINASPERITHV